jgi:hypothetical protein
VRLIPSRIAILCAGALALAGAGWALASGGGGGDAPAAQPAPNSGSAAPGSTPQREVAVQPALAAPRSVDPAP